MSKEEEKRKENVVRYINSGVNYLSKADKDIVDFFKDDWFKDIPLDDLRRLRYLVKRLCDNEDRLRIYYRLNLHSQKLWLRK